MRNVSLDNWNRNFTNLFNLKFCSKSGSQFPSRNYKIHTAIFASKLHLILTKILITIFVLKKPLILTNVARYTRASFVPNHQAQSLGLNNISLDHFTRFYLQKFVSCDKHRLQHTSGKFVAKFVANTKFNFIYSGTRNFVFQDRSTIYVRVANACNPSSFVM